MSATMERTQRYIFFALPFLFIPFIINFKAGLVLYWATTNLWTVGQGIVTRRLVPRTKVAPPEEELADAAAGRDRERGCGRRGDRVAPEPATVAAVGAFPAPPREAEEEAQRPAAMTADGGFAELEASGETIGEAKWQAMRELERLHPGLDRNAVTFEVLTEGERGLLGVGTSPARVLARVESGRRARGCRRPARPTRRSAELLCERRRANRRELGARARVTVAEDDEMRAGHGVRARRRAYHRP